MKKTLLPLLSLLTAACNLQKIETYSITDFGAVPETICTQAIQAAIDKASGGRRRAGACSAGRVFIGHGAYRRPHARCVLERSGLSKDYSPELLI